MAPKKKDLQEENVEPQNTTLNQIKDYLKDNKDHHYNFEQEEIYTVSSGSLTLDIEMGGGIRPGIVRFSGPMESGKTNCALSFARNFQQTVKDGMVVYIKAEGRLTQEIIERSGIDVSPEKWFLFKCNIYETVIGLMRKLVSENPENKKYFFIIDSMDGLVRKEDNERPMEEANKVGGNQLLSSDFLRKMALAMSVRGHIVIMISQVRSTIKLNPYEKTDYKPTNSSGGNAILHYSDWILEFLPKYNKTLITDGKDGPIIGHYCRIEFKKSPNEKTGVEVKYPVRYGMKNGKSVWVEHEVADMMLAFDMAKAKGAWVEIAPETITSLKEKGLEMPDKFNGEVKFKAFFEENPKVTEHFFNMFKEVLKK